MSKYKVVVYAFGSSITVIFLLANYYSIESLNYLGAGLLTILSILMTEPYLIGLLVFLSPYQRDIVFPSTNVSLLNIVLFLVLIKQIGRNLKIDTSLLITIIITFSYISVVSYLNDNLTQIVTNTKSFLLFISLSLFAHSKNPKYFGHLVDIFIIGTVFVGVSVLALGYVSGKRFAGGFENDPNLYATVLVFSFSCLIVRFQGLSHRHLWQIVLLSLVLLLGLLTQSRTFAFSIILFIILYLLTTKSKITQVRILVAIIIVVGIVLGIIWVFPNLQQSFELLINRIVSPRNQDISGGRFDLWKLYYKYIMRSGQSLLFGFSKTRTAFPTRSVAHNYVIDLIGSMGIVGLGLILLTYLVFIKSLKFQPNSDLERGFQLNRTNMHLPLAMVFISNLSLYSILGISIIVQVFLGVMLINLDT